MWKKSKKRITRTDWPTDWLTEVFSCVQAQTWPSSACCAGSVSRPRRLCSSTWRCTPASAATSAASATGPSPATPHSSATYAHTQVSESLSSAPRLLLRRCEHMSRSNYPPASCSTQHPRPQTPRAACFRRKTCQPFKPDVPPESDWCIVGKWIVLLCSGRPISRWTHNPVLLKERHQLIREAGRSVWKCRSSPVVPLPATDHPLPPSQTHSTRLSADGLRL